MAKKPETEKVVSAEDRVAQLSHQLQEQADVASIWQEKWQESENANITLRRDLKRLQRQNTQPAPSIPAPANEE